MDNQETVGNQKTNNQAKQIKNKTLKKKMGSVAGSSIIPILNPTCIYIPGLMNAKEVTGSCGYQGIN